VFKSLAGRKIKMFEAENLLTRTMIPNLDFGIFYYVRATNNNSDISPLFIIKQKLPLKQEFQFLSN